MDYDGTAARRLTARGAFDALYSRWAPDLAPRTRRRYVHDLARWERLSSDPPIAEISTDTYQRFRAAATSRGLAASTTESTLRTIRQVLRCAQVHGAIRVLPDRGRARRVAAPEPNPPSIEELDALVRHVDAARWPRLHVPPATFWRSWIAVDLWTGLRMSDICWELAVEHYDQAEQVIRFRASKTGRLHAFPVSDTIERHLRAILPPYRVPAAHRIFGCPKCPRDIRRELERMCKAARIRTVTPQQFRQAAITAWSIADPTAGGLVHGVGIPKVLHHYLDRVALLRAVMDDVQLPPALTEFQGGERQGRLF